MEKKLELQALAVEIEILAPYIKKDLLDPYIVMTKLSIKYIKPVDKLYDTRLDDNPYADMLFSLMEVQGIEFY